MFDMDLDPVTWASRIIHELTGDCIYTEGDGIVVVIDHKLVGPVAADRGVEKPFLSCQTKEGRVVAAEILLIIP
jgi:hypothetical protein